MGPSCCFIFVYLWMKSFQNHGTVTSEWGSFMKIHSLFERTRLRPNITARWLLKIIKSEGVGFLKYWCGRRSKNSADLFELRMYVVLLAYFITINIVLYKSSSFFRLQYNIIKSVNIIGIQMRSIYARILLGKINFLRNRWEKLV